MRAWCCSNLQVTQTILSKLHLKPNETLHPNGSVKAGWGPLPLEHIRPKLQVHWSLLQPREDQPFSVGIFFFLMLTIHFTHAENSTLKVNFEKFPLQVSLTNQPPQLGAGWNCFRLNVNEGGGTCWKKGGEFALFWFLSRHISVYINIWRSDQTGFTVLKKTLTGSKLGFKKEGPLGEQETFSLFNFCSNQHQLVNHRFIGVRMS